MNPLVSRRRNRNLRIILLAFLALHLVILTGCAIFAVVPNRAYRDRNPWPDRENGEQQPFVRGEQLPQYEPYNAATGNHKFDLSYIEFDEEGDYWDRRQLGWTVREIGDVAKKNNVVLVVYVHGWQNDASTLRGHDVGKFHCLLEHLAEADEQSNRYFGIYIAWRGKSVPGGDGWFPERSIPDLVSKAIFFLPHELSLYSRKNAATRIAGMPVTEAIFQTVAAARNKTKGNGHKAKTILIGHSFGALLLEKALAQALAAKVISEDPTAGGTFVAPADFVVLLNSAAPSIYAKELIDMLRRRKPAFLNAPGADQISPKQPLVVSVTSTADWATGKLFPIGTTFSTLFANLRRYEWDNLYGESSHYVSQRYYLTHTPGHNNFLINYEAVPIAGSPQRPIYEESDDCKEGLLAALKRNMAEGLSGPNREIRFYTLDRAGHETTWQLNSTIREDLQTPYWVIKVPKEIMRNHGDIFNENALALLARLFELSNPHSEAGIITTSAPRTMAVDALPRPK